MFVKVQLVPRRIRTAEPFEAPDPWAGGQRSAFRVEVYKLFPAHVSDPREWRDGTVHTIGAKELFGIRSERDGVERMLPTFLADAYAAGQVPAERLPELLARVEPELSGTDFRPLPGRGALRVAAAGLVLAFLGGAGLAALGGSAPRAMLRVVEAGAWLAGPVSVGETYAVGGMVPLEGREPAPASLVVPDEVARAAGRSFRIGWARAGAGHRALLLPERTYERGGAVDLGYVVVKLPADLGLAPSLESLRARVPDLDTSAISCSRWVESAPRGAGEPLRVASLLLLLVGVPTALGCGLAWLASEPRRRRNRDFAMRFLGGIGVAPR
jgi:hypothetical protein